MGVVRATWRILEFHTPWNIFGTAKHVKFCVLAGYIRRPIVPERGVTKVTWFISKFYTPLNFSWMAKDKIVEFCTRLAEKCLSHDDKLSPRWAWSTSRDVLIFWQISYYLESGAKYIYTFNGRLIGNSIWPIKWQQRQPPCMTLKVIHQLQAISNAIHRTFVQHFTRLMGV